MHDRNRCCPRPGPGRPTEAYADKIFAALLGTMETFSLYLGERLGWLAALADRPLTAAELAAHTATAERYALEWLEMQAVYGNAGGGRRRRHRPVARRTRCRRRRPRC